jgi:hypothetical protein
MKQRRRPTKRKMQTKSREWLEAECLRLARQTRGGRDIQRVTIRRLNPRGVGPNWKAADLIPLPPLAVIDEVRAKFAHLPDTYVLDVDSE